MKGYGEKPRRGAISKTIVVKHYVGKTVITSYPRMQHIKPSEKQVARRQAFAAAVAYAQEINNNPLLKAGYSSRLDKGRSVYHAALSEYLSGIHPRIPQGPGSPLVR